MVRDYKKKTNRQSWSTEAMNNAVEAVISGQCGCLKASNQFDVPQSTLERYVKKRKENPDYKIDKTAGKFKNVFTEEQELELVNYLKTMEARLFGLTMKDLRSLAYQLAVRNGISHRFKNGIAGQDWVNGFLKRHPTLSVRKPEATSGARAMGFNKVAVDSFFSLLTSLLDKHKLTASQIFNCDETGVSVNPKNQSKIIACKGKRQVGSLTSAERGETVTGLICMSASGAYMPPMLIFPRKKNQKEFELGLPPGGWAEVHSTGWMTAASFLVWFRKFVEFSKASNDFPVLLILDGHSTHTKNLEVIDYARESGVSLLCLPPHCSHRLQPLDVSFMKPLSLHYSDELRKWLRSNPGKVITLFQVSTLFGSAFIQSATMKTAINGFQATGIWPTDPSIFTDADFLPADTTDIGLGRPSSEEMIISGAEKLELPSPSTPVKKDMPLRLYDKAGEVSPNSNDDTPAKKVRFNEANCATPGCSWMTTDNRASSFHVSPEILMPIPKVKESVKRTNRKRWKTAVLTDSPYKKELEAAIKEKEEKNFVKEERARIKLFKKENKIKNGKNKGKCRKINKKKKTLKREPKTNEGDSEDCSDCECLYCGECYSKSVEGWVACSMCKKWAHNSCAGIDSEDDEAVLVCEFCE